MKTRVNDRNAMSEEMKDYRENLRNSGIVRYYPHMLTSGYEPLLYGRRGVLYPLRHCSHYKCW